MVIKRYVAVKVLRSMLRSTRTWPCVCFFFTLHRHFYHTYPSKPNDIGTSSLWNIQYSWSPRWYEYQTESMMYHYGIFETRSIICEADARYEVHTKAVPDASGGTPVLPHSQFDTSHDGVCPPMLIYLTIWCHLCLAHTKVHVLGACHPFDVCHLNFTLWLSARMYAPEYSCSTNGHGYVLHLVKHTGNIFFRR